MKEEKDRKKPDDPKPEKVWVLTPTSNLIRYTPSGTYYARVRVASKLIKKTLNTNVYSIAKLRLADFVKERRSQAGESRTASTEKLTFGDALGIFRQRLKDRVDLKPGAKVYREKTVASLLKTWPGISVLDVAKISKDDCTRWAATARTKYSASVFNNTLGTLGMVFDIAVEKNARYSNPTSDIVRAPIAKCELRLPSNAQLETIVRHIEGTGARFSRGCAELVRFLAFGGFRKTEAANITWADCNFEKHEILVRITKNGHERTVPMIPEMEKLLEDIRKHRPGEPPTTGVMQVHECQKALDGAFHALNTPRITHHDLRHIFATVCIESGVDVPTVSKWLGHQDGGALAMKVYGHLRMAHNRQMAAKVSFGTSHANSSLFSMDSVKKMSSFATKLKQPSDLVSTFLKSKLSEGTLKVMEKYQGGKPNLQSLQIILVQDLNTIIKGGSIYDAKRFAGVNLGQEAKKLLEQNPQGEDLVRLNRLLLEDAYPEELPRIPSSEAIES